MITTEQFTAKDSICDWCCAPIPDGECIGLSGYLLVYGDNKHRLKMLGPFVPCSDCARMLGLPTVNFDLILKLHKTVAVKFKVNPDEVSIVVN